MEVANVVVVEVVAVEVGQALDRLTTSCLMSSSNATWAEVSCASSWSNFALRAGSRAARLVCAVASMTAIATRGSLRRNILVIMSE